MSDDTPPASVYLRMLWGHTGDRLGQPEPPAAPPEPEPINLDALPKKPPNRRHHLRSDGRPKDAYRSPWRAEGVIRKLKASANYTPVPRMELTVYLCEECAQWHIGHMKIE